MKEKFISDSAEKTQEIGLEFAKKILEKLSDKSRVIVLCLRGELGGGKTTFLQGFAKGLEVKEKILSPTFAILKKFNANSVVFFHFDYYRISKPEEILELGFKEIIHPPAGSQKSIVAIEWPEKIKKYLPKNSLNIDFIFVDESKREIIFETK